MLVAVLMLCAVPSFALSQFALKGTLCEEWNKLEKPEWNSSKRVRQFEGGVIATIEAAYRIKTNVAVVGSVGFPFETKLTRYAVGVEVALWSGTLVDPK